MLSMMTWMVSGSNTVVRERFHSYCNSSGVLEVAIDVITEPFSASDFASKDGPKRLLLGNPVW